MQSLDYVVIFKAMSDVTRFEIVKMLSGGELCACRILESFHITQPTLSYHMKNLCESGLVIGHRDGAWMRYNINAEKLEALKAFFNNFELLDGENSNHCRNEGC